MDNDTATIAQLTATARIAGWKPADLRAEASTLDDGCHIASKYLDEATAKATADNMRADAARLEAEGEAAAAELARRKAAAGAIRIGYVA